MASLRDLLTDFPGAPSAPAVHWRGETWSAGELEQRAGDLAAALRDAGAGPGRPVAVSLPDSADVVTALFGVWTAGAVYVPCNPRLADREVDRILEQLRPAAVVTTADQVERFGALPAVVTTAEGWVGRAGQAPNGDRSDPDIALIQFTSGTTGAPKPVLLGHSGVLELLDGVIGTLRSTPADGERPPMPNLVPVSLSLWAGIYQVLFAFRVGAPVVVLGPFDTRAFASTVKEFGIRSTVLPPAAMTMLADDAGIDDLSPLKYVRSITAPLSPLQARRFRDRFGIAVLNCYGQTEIGGEIVGWSGADSKQFGVAKLGSVGRPHAGVTARVVDPAGAVLDADQPGELQVRTPALAAGYAGGDDLSDRMTGDGWFRTGDIARIDADGFIWLEGRVSDMINRGGLKVFPGEVAEVLRLAADVADAAVVGVADDRLGEVPVAFVVPRDGASVDPGALERLCRQHLAPYKVPVRFELIDELPRNEIGKVLNRMLTERAVR